jgi:aldehyde dehydrogenase (NAD+)
VPKGVLNMVLGSGGTVGHALLDHDAVRAVSFTGSNDVGSGIYAQAAKKMIRAQCEMGGKNPVVVLADADLDLAVEATAQGAFGSTGQRCTATSRVIVEDGRRRHVRRAAGSPVGQGQDRQRSRSRRGHGPCRGPVTAQDRRGLHRDRPAGRREARARRPPARGRRPAHGYFVEPTVFDHVTVSMRVAQEEIFGPVISVIRGADFEKRWKRPTTCATACLPRSSPPT